MTIKSLQNTSISQLLEAWALAFDDYPYQWTAEELLRMLVRRGYVAGLSFGAFDNGRLVAFTLNGLGDYNGLRTAYDTGTGTIKDYRGRGLAKAIFKEATAPLIAAGARQYVLEVLTHNAAAISVYTKLGFSISREYNYFMGQASEVNKIGVQHIGNVALRKIDLHDEQIGSHVATMQSFYDYPPAWQNSFDAVFRSPAGFQVVGAFIGEVLIGYGILDIASGDIPQLAVHPAHRRMGIGALLFRLLCAVNTTNHVQFINVDKRTVAATAFLLRHNLPVSGTQYEMTLKLV